MAHTTLGADGVILRREAAWGLFWPHAHAASTRDVHICGPVAAAKVTGPQILPLRSLAGALNVHICGPVARTPATGPQILPRRACLSVWTRTSYHSLKRWTPPRLAASALGAAFQLGATSPLVRLLTWAQAMAS